MSQAGYYRYPTVHRDTVVFVCEDDLWTVPAAGGVARRLTSSLGQAALPALSPDGEWLAFTGRDEGHSEVYCMPAVGGPARRLTFLGADSRVVGWAPDGGSILFASNTAQPFVRQYRLHALDRDGGEPRELPTGPAMSIAYGPQGGAVIGRNTTDIARWKRYRGGLTGDLWIDEPGNGGWRRLIQLPGNVALPLWVGERILFLSDHEGIGNLYSCRPSGEDLRRHTHHTVYYARHAATDGRQVVYHAGADLYLFDPAADQARTIDVEFHSPRTQRNRKFVGAGQYLQGYALHPKGQRVAIVARGKPFTLANWEGAVTQHGELRGARYRLAAWLADGERVVVASDAAGEEALEIHAAATSEPVRLNDLDIGRPVSLLASPKKNQLALTNHRNELTLVDLDERTARVLDRSRFSRIRGFAWSPDGRWIAYGFHDTRQTSLIKLCLVETGQSWAATKPVLTDVAPAFDPEGKYLYFLSYREFNPVYDHMHFDLGFPKGMRPHLVTLQADTVSPFVPVPPPDESDEPSGPEPDDQAAEDGARQAAASSQEPGEQHDGGQPDGKKEERPLHIDLDGITERIVTFPVSEGHYGQIRGLKGKVLFSSYPVEGALGEPWEANGPPAAKGKIEVYDFKEQKCETWIEGISSFELAQDAQTLIYRAGNHLRVLKAAEKPPSDGDAPGRKSGWLDLARIKLSVDPAAEWEQMYREAWRLQRDRFWTADMSGIDWQVVYERYLPLIDRVATRAEFSDLLWEMQGELGTSHAYEFGGDYRAEPAYTQGLLGADLRYDPESDSYVVAHIVQGDVWDEPKSSPLARPGINILPGDRLTAVGGRRVGRGLSPHELLVNQAENEVALTFAGRDGGEPRTVTVKTLRSDTPARYREWVDANRRQVHEATGGRVGYLHIPDMGPRGYAEFHRGFLAELDRPGLLVDVRFNGGGHVSQLLLEKLARRRIGYDIPRWGEPVPYPSEAALGPLVALANEQAGSDGDMFSHAFKLMRLGPLIGKRTWGGVIGIHVRDSLVDGGFTTQPEFSFWFADVGWGLENYGTDPDIEVEIRPQDDRAGEDAQLERAIAEIERLLAENPPRIPDFSDRPRLGLPTLPEPRHTNGHHPTPEPEGVTASG